MDRDNNTEDPADRIRFSLSGDQMNASTAVKKAMPLCCHQRIEKLIWTNQNVRHGFQFTISADEDDEDYTPPTSSDTMMQTDCMDKGNSLRNALY